MDVQAIQQALATAAGNISGLRAFATVPDAINPPTFGVIEMEVEYNKTFSTSGLTEMLFTCGVYTSMGYTDVGKTTLVGYMSPTGSGSVKAALEADKTLSGNCSTLHVERVKGAYRLYTIGGTDYLGALYDVRVWAV